MEALVGMILLCIAIGVFAWKYFKVIVRLVFFALIGFGIWFVAECFNDFGAEPQNTATYEYMEMA